MGHVFQGRYQAFVAQGKGQPSPWQQLKNQIYLGDEQFVARMQKQIADYFELHYSRISKIIKNAE